MNPQICAGTVAATPNIVVLMEAGRATVPWVRARAILRAIDAAGHSAAEIAAAVGLEAAPDADLEARIPLARLDALFEEGARRTGDLAFGLHVAEHAHPRMFDVIGYALMNAPCLLEAFSELTPYLTGYHGGEELKLVIDDRYARFAYRVTDGRGRASRHRAESYLATLLSLARSVLGATLEPLNVAFVHQAPSDIAEHRRIFAAPLHFGCPINEIVFDVAVTKTPIPTADPDLWALLCRYLSDIGSRALRAQTATVASEVRKLIHQALQSGDHSMTRVAKRLAMSSRTLQRCLHREGTSYHALLDEIRRELGLRYLRESPLPVSRIAELLGYATAGACHDAFQRWTGVTPADYRRAALQSA